MAGHPAGSEGPAGGDESLELYRTLTQLSPDAIAIHAEGRVIFTNPAGLRLFGAGSSGEGIGRSVLDFVHPHDHQAVLQRVKVMRETGQAVPPTEERFVTVDGREVYGEAAASPILYQGKPAILVIIRDVTERK